MTSFEDCGGPYDLTPVHTISSWESQPTTHAETMVTAFLEAQPNYWVGKRLLHVGIGNCSLLSALAPDLATFVGITISLPEKQLFEKTFSPSDRGRVVLANKYDPRRYSDFGGQFDLIVDVNLKSFACCKKHFWHLMALYAALLPPGGTLITAESGLLFGWTGNTNVAYTPGAQLDPFAAQLRVLGLDELDRLSGSLGLCLTRVPCIAAEYAVSVDETLWLLTRSRGNDEIRYLQVR